MLSNCDGILFSFSFEFAYAQSKKILFPKQFLIILMNRSNPTEGKCLSCRPDYQKARAFIKAP